MSKKNEKFHQQACSFEGFLHKKSPQLFVGYQKRFFCIRDNGKKLVYYKDKPSIKDKPKGVIEISDIIDIIVHDATEFYITYAERKFELKAASKQERDKWIQMLKYLKEYIFEEDNTALKVSFSNADSDEKKQKWRMENLDTQTLNNIQAENEINILKNTTESSMSESVMLQNNDEQILEVKGIAEFTRRIDPDIIDPRMCCGFLSKKGKTNLTKYKKRWFILVSDNILEAESIADPDKIIVDSQLPPWMRINTIYYFKYDKIDDKSNFIGKISLKKIKNLVLEGVNEDGTLENIGKGILNFGANFGKIFGFDAATFKKPEHGYGFRLEAQDRTYYLYADLATEMNKWVVAIYRAMNSIQIKDNSVPSRSLTVDSKDEKARTNAIKPDETNFKTMTKPLKLNDGEEKLPRKATSAKSRQTVSSRDSPSMSLDSSKLEEFKPANNSIKEGYINKKSSNKLVGWQQRWVVLKKDSFSWFRSNNDKNPQNIVLINTIKQCLSLKDTEFMILVGEKTVKFKTEESEERDSWVHTINNTMLNKDSSDIPTPVVERTKTDEFKPGSRRDSGNEGNSKFSKYFSLDDKSIKIEEKSKPKNFKAKDGPKSQMKSVNDEEFVPFHPESDFFRKKKEKSCWSKIFCCCVQEEDDNYYMKYN